MIPTLQIGDYVVVEKWAYGVRLPFTDRAQVMWSSPERGDIVVLLAPPGNPRNDDLIKRVVGVAGDTVEVKNGALWLNGTAVPRRAIDGPCTYENRLEGGPWRTERCTAAEEQLGEPPLPHLLHARRRMRRHPAHRGAGRDGLPGRRPPGPQRRQPRLRAGAGGSREGARVERALLWGPGRIPDEPGRAQRESLTGGSPSFRQDVCRRAPGRPSPLRRPRGESVRRADSAYRSPRTAIARAGSVNGPDGRPSRSRQPSRSSSRRAGVWRSR